MNPSARIRDWAVLALLLLVSMAIMVNKNVTVTRSLRAVSLQTVSGLESQFSRIGAFMRAQEENETLREHNIVMSSQLARLRDAQLENERLRGLLALRDTLNVPSLAVRIVARDVHRQKNFVIIDAGESDGLASDMAVVDDNGVIGKVVQPGDDYSLVQTYLNTDFRVPGLIQPLQTFGIVRWDGTQLDRLLLDYVVRTEPVRKGQLVVTSGSSIFPSGIPIGTVDSVAVRAGENLLEIFLTPATAIGSAKHAFVILKTPDDELEALQRANP